MQTPVLAGQCTQRYPSGCASAGLARKIAAPSLQAHLADCLQGKGKGSASKGKATAASPSTPNQPTPARPTASSSPQRTAAPTSSPVPIPRSSPQPSSNTPIKGSCNSPDAHGDCTGASPSTPAGHLMKKGRKWQQQQAASRAAEAGSSPGVADAAFGSSPGSDCGGSDSKGAHGRRARRNAKKAAADARALALIPGM